MTPLGIPQLKGISTQPSHPVPAYFDRIKHSQLSGSASSDELANLASGEPHEIYEAIVDMEKGRRGRLLTILPIKPLWDLFMIGTRDTCRCCFCGKDAEFQAMSCGRKSWFALRKLVKVLLNLGAIFMAGISCAAAVQTSVTMSKLPYVRAIYLKLNEGEVCKQCQQQLLYSICTYLF